MVLQWDSIFRVKFEIIIFFSDDSEENSEEDDDDEEEEEEAEAGEEAKENAEADAASAEPSVSGETEEDEKVKDNESIGKWQPIRSKFAKKHKLEWSSKVQLNTEWMYEVIVSPQMQTKKLQGFLPYYQTNKHFFWWV